MACALTLASTACFSATTSNTLPVEIEAERLILAAKHAIENKEIEAAHNYLLRAEALNTPLANNFHFFRGKVSFFKHEIENAQQHLIQFAQRIEADNTYYEETLSLLTAIEKKGEEITKGTKKGTPQEKPHIQWHSSKNSKPYLENLKRLYLTEHEKAALELHINDLLRSHPFSKTPASPISAPHKSLGNPLTLSSAPHQSQNYNIQTTHQGAIKTHLTTNNRSTPNNTTAPSPSKEVTLNASELSVYGLSHQIEYKCSDTLQRCWIKNPVSNAAWLELGNNESAAAELAKAMGYLVQVMQQQ